MFVGKALLRNPNSILNQTLSGKGLLHLNTKISQHKFLRNNFARLHIFLVAQASLSRATFVNICLIIHLGPFFATMCYLSWIVGEK